MSNTANNYNLKTFYTEILKRSPLRFGHQFFIEFHTDDSTVGHYFGNLNPGSELTFGYFVKTSKIPAVDINSARVSFFGAGFEVPGVIKYPETWEVKILLEGRSHWFKSI